MAENRNLAACLLIAALAGCAAGGPLPLEAISTVPERPTREAPPLPGTPGTETRLAAADGTAVVATEWIPENLPENPKAVVVALHGYGDHGQLTFRGPAAAWAEQGIATIAPDQRGFGRNSSRGRWPGADTLIADATAFVTQARQRFPCAPVILLGHSMGGGVALAAAPEAAPDALVLAAPAIWGGDVLNPLHRMAAWIAASVAPDRRFTGRGVVRIIPSDNPAALKSIWADPHYLAPPSAREIFGLVRITDRGAEAAPRTFAPALLLLGEQDQIVPDTAVRSVFARLKGPLDVISYPAGWHLLFRDNQAPRVWSDIARFALDAPRQDPFP